MRIRHWSKIGSLAVSVARKECGHFNQVGRKISFRYRYFEAVVVHCYSHSSVVIRRMQRMQWSSIDRSNSWYKKNVYVSNAEFLWQELEYICTGCSGSLLTVFICAYVATSCACVTRVVNRNDLTHAQLYIASEAHFYPPSKRTNGYD